MLLAGWKINEESLFRPWFQKKAFTTRCRENIFRARALKKNKLHRTSITPSPNSLITSSASWPERTQLIPPCLPLQLLHFSSHRSDQGRWILSCKPACFINFLISPRSGSQAAIKCQLGQLRFQSRELMSRLTVHFLASCAMIHGGEQLLEGEHQTAQHFQINFQLCQ